MGRGKGATSRPAGRRPQGNGLTVERRPGVQTATLSPGAQKVEAPVPKEVGATGLRQPAAPTPMPGSRSKLPSSAAYGKLASAPDVLSAADDRGRFPAPARPLAQPLRASTARSSPRRLGDKPDTRFSPDRSPSDPPPTRVSTVGVRKPGASWSARSWRADSQPNLRGVRPGGHENGCTPSPPISQSSSPEWNGIATA